MAAAPCSSGIAAIGNPTIPEEGFKKGDLKFTLDGDKLHGSWVLVRMRNDRNGGKRTNWLLIKHRDEYAKEGKANDILDEDQSVASGRTMEEIAAGKGKAPKPFMTREDRPRQGRCGLAFEPRAMPPTARGAERKATKGVGNNGQTAKSARRSRRCRISSRPQLCTSVERPPSGGRLVP